MENPVDAQFGPHTEGIMNITSPRGRRLALWLVAVVSALALSFVAANAPALAHGKKQHAPAQQTQAKGTSGDNGVAATPNGAAAEAGNMGMMDSMGMAADRSKLPFWERLLGWLGRLHPLVVHFPIAFFPAALFTAIVGRRRPAFSAPVQFLVVAGGIFAPLAAAAGWLTGMTADPEPVLTYHRWLGVLIGVAGAGLGVWAARRPWEDRGAGMILALTIMTIAIAAQGFMGAALTHGMDHLMF